MMPIAAKYYENGIPPFPKNKQRVQELVETANKIRLEYYDYAKDIIKK